MKISQNQSIISSSKLNSLSAANVKQLLKNDLNIDACTNAHINTINEKINLNDFKKTDNIFSENLSITSRLLSSSPTHLSSETKTVVGVGGINSVECIGCSGIDLRTNIDSIRPLINNQTSRDLCRTTSDLLKNGGRSSSSSGSDIRPLIVDTETINPYLSDDEEYLRPLNDYQLNTFDVLRNIRNKYASSTITTPTTAKPIVTTSFRNASIEPSLSSPYENKFLSLSISPPLSRRQEMPVLRGSFVSL